MIAIAVYPEKDWMDDGRCMDMDNGWFFDEDNDPAARETAKTVCAGCPVRDSCLSYALVADERIGVWGGTGEKERWNLAAKIHGAARLARRGCKCSPCVDTRKTLRIIRSASI